MKSWRNIPARIISNVTDVMFEDDDMVWKIGRSKKYNHRINLDVMESDYQFVYVMGEDTFMYGCKNMIKWIVWNHYLIGDMTESAATAYIKRNPVNES